MNMDEYQRLASRTANVSETPLANFALGVAGEAGEVADLVKKYIYHGHELDKEALEKELGDVLWYVSQIANWADIRLSDVAQANIDKLQKRYPDGFSQVASRSRTE